MRVLTEEEYPSLVRHFREYRDFPAVSIDPNYIGSGKLLRRAIKKYGRHNFYVMDVLDVADTIEELNYKEEHWICEYRRMGYKLYNIANGGDGGDLITNLPEKQKQELRQKHRQNALQGVTIICKYASKPGELNGMFGKKHSEVSKQKNRLAHLGRKASEQTKQKMRMSHKLDNIPPNVRGLIFVYRDDINKLINPEQLDYYLNNGWIKESKCINNGTQFKRVAKNCVDKYISEGWVYGRLPKNK